MPRTVPSGSLIALLASETGQAYLVLLTLTHNSVGSPATWTSDVVDTVYNGTTFTPYPFDIILPSNESGKVQESQLTIDNISRQIIDVLRAQSTPILCRIDIVASDDVGDGISTGEATASFTDLVLRSIEYDQVQITGRLTTEDFLSEPYPKERFTQGYFPGLFVQGGSYDGDYTYVGPDIDGCSDFGEYTLGAVAFDWTIVSESTADKSALVVADTGQFSYTAQDQWLTFLDASESIWDGSDFDADVEVLIEMDQIATDEWNPAIILRAQTGADAAPYSKQYALMYKDVPAGTSILGWYYRTTSGAYTLIGSSVDVSLGAAGRMCIRARVEGTALKAKVWLGGEGDEPGLPTAGWQLEETDSNVAGVGSFGILNQEVTGTRGISRIAHAIEGATASFNCILDEPLAQAAYTNFGEYTTGSPANPANWADEWSAANFGDLDIVADAGKSGGKLLRMNMTSSGRYGMWTWDDVGSVADLEILYKGTFFDTGTDQCNAVCWRVQGEYHHDGTNTIEWYQTGISTTGVPRVHHIAHQPSEDDTDKNIHGADVSALAISDGDEYWCRVQMIGTAIKAKWWVTSLESEPAAWTYEFSDNSITGAGRMGVVCETGSTAGWNDDTDYDQIAVAINGDTAYFQ